MPELPEVETIARTLAPQIQGTCLEAIQVLLPRTLAFGAQYLTLLRGYTLTRVWRRAKLLLIEAKGKQPITLVFHLKMTGRLFVHKAQNVPHAHTRMVFGLIDGAMRKQLFFDDTRTFGYCRIMQEQDFAQWDFWKSLGPEPLHISKADFLAQTQGKSGGIKALLLNQKFIAGIGNIYADEALFRAGIRPDTKAQNLTPKVWAHLLEQIQVVLQESIDQCGSSIRDYRDAHGNAGAFQNTFYVYGRGGAPCRVCGQVLQANRIAGRTTVFCPSCQQ